jgi:uncharacterized membrane protein
MSSVQLAAPALAEPVSGKRVRLESIDVVRGVIMILMALDHTRDFFGNSGLNPTNPQDTTAPLFFSRWITHFCAPPFFRLTGTGAYLARRKMSTSELSRFLFTRGRWLIFLEVVVSRSLGWQFNFDYQVVMLIVLVGAGQGNDHAVGSGLPAPLGRGDLRRGEDRDVTIALTMCHRPAGCGRYCTCPTFWS